MLHTLLEFKKSWELNKIPYLMFLCRAIYATTFFIVIVNWTALDKVPSDAPFIADFFIFSLVPYFFLSTITFISRGIFKPFTLLLPFFTLSVVSVSLAFSLVFIEECQEPSLLCTNTLVINYALALFAIYLLLKLDWGEGELCVEEPVEFEEVSAE